MMKQMHPSYGSQHVRVHRFRHTLINLAHLGRIEVLYLFLVFEKLLHSSHLFDHLAELLVLVKERVDLDLHDPGSTGDPRHSVGLTDEGLRGVHIVKLLVVHAVHDCHESLESLHALLVTDLTSSRPASEYGVEAGDHPHHLRDRARLHDVLELLVHVPQCEPPLLDVFHHLLLVHVEILHSLHQSLYVPHAKQFPDERLLLKRLEIVDVFPGTDEDDGTLSSCHSRESSSSLGVAVQLGDHDTGVHHEHDIVWLDGVTDGQHLLEETVLLLMSSAGVHNDDLEALVLEHLHPVPSDDGWVHLGVTSIERDPRLGGVLLQLIVSPGPEGVGTDQAGLPVLLLVVVGQLGAGGGLTGTLKTDKHDDVRFAFLGLVGLDPGVDKCDKFLKYCLLDDDSLVQALSDFIKVNRFLDIVFQLLHQPDINVSLQ